MMRRPILKLSFILGFLSVLLLSTAAVADDLFPPPWRGEPGTTFAEWNFDPGSDPFDPLVPADAWVGPGDPPIAQVTFGVGQEYQPEWGGRLGVLPLSGEIVIELPNYDVPNPLKEIWIQITWAQQAPDTAPLVWADAGPDYTVWDTILLNELPIGPTNEPPPAGTDWIHSTYGIVVEPNPAWETIYISGAVMVDQVVIDTICVPEPATLSLLGIGGLAILLRFRRKR